MIIKEQADSQKCLWLNAEESFTKASIQDLSLCLAFYKKTGIEDTRFLQDTHF